MTRPLAPPKRKDPLKRTRLGHIPPDSRSRAATGMAVRAAMGRFVLQVCRSCATVTYPPRDRCPACWDLLDWRDQPPHGVVLAATTIRVSTDRFFRDHLPWRIGTVALAAGPAAITHLHGDVRVGDRVRMRLMLDRAGNPALFALPQPETPHMEDDAQFRLFTAHPRHRRILVTDGRGPVGQAVARSLVAAGARLVFLGNADPLMRYNGQEAVESLDRVEPLPLNLTDSRGTTELASRIGGRVDIVVNTAGLPRPGGAGLSGRLTDLQNGFDLEVAGLMRLARACAPAMSARSGDGVNAAAAFVDIASVYGLTGRAGYAGMATLAAARLTLLAGLRGEMMQTGIRVVSLLTGPVDDEWHQSVPPPKLSPAAIGQAVVQALVDGRELVCVGPVAADVLARWQADPLLAIREENR